MKYVVLLCILAMFTVVASLTIGHTLDVTLPGMLNCHKAGPTMVDGEGLKRTPYLCDHPDSSTSVVWKIEP